MTSFVYNPDHWNLSDLAEIAAVDESGDNRRALVILRLAQAQREAAELARGSGDEADATRAQRLARLVNRIVEEGLPEMGGAT